MAENIDRFLQFEVIDLMKKTNRPMTSREIFRSKDIKTGNKSSVYAAMKRLVDKGLVKKIKYNLKEIPTYVLSDKK